MNKILLKIRSWWNGEINFDKEVFHKDEFCTSDTLPNILNGDESHYMRRPRTRLVLTAIWQFWLRRWMILLPLIVMATVLLFIHFDSKATRKPKEEKETSVNKAYLNHKDSNNLIEK